ncbi:MAG: CD225/dispanin family protein [Clostridia bacterium]|nr:CD225/dispanin family protein [Clostridia bacterium]
MKYCKNCSASLDDDAVFCTECGASLADDNFDSSASRQSGYDGFQGSIPTPSSSNYTQENQQYSSGNNYSGTNYSQPQQQQYNGAPPNRKNPGMPWLITALVTLFCCSNLFTIPGLVLSIMSVSSFNAGNIDESMSRANTAKWLVIGGIVLGVIVNVIGIVWLVSEGTYTYY